MYFKHDVIVIGAGLAGSRAALELAGRCDVAVLSKVFPTRSHSCAAQGGVAAALANREEDHPVWHAFDTVKGSDYLGDQDAIEFMCEDAIRMVYELEHFGVPFSRTADGRIAQRPFGGHTRDFGKAPVRRACYAADRTGHVMLHTLYEQCVRRGVRFYDEFQVFDLFIEDGRVTGACAVELATGELHVFHAKAIVLATGGYGRMYATTSNALANTADGMALCYLKGLPLEDMEFVQFHPTGIYTLGILITEAARGEGGILRNKDGERFMERYAPTVKDLAPRDMVSRCILKEIRAGRGFADGRGRPYIELDLTHLGREKVYQRLPDIAGFCNTYLGVDPAVKPIPIHPTAHYAMGGIPTDIEGRVLREAPSASGQDAPDPGGMVPLEPVPGLYAAGECACVSVHGGNRLGTNSLLDTVVFGRRAAIHLLGELPNLDFGKLPPEPTGVVRERMEKLRNSTGPRPIEYREKLADVMMQQCSVFRTEQTLGDCLQQVTGLRDSFAEQGARLDDKGGVFNTDMVEALETRHILETAHAVVTCALNRTESRGAHFREDHPERDDANWLKHSLVWREPGGGAHIGYKPVSITQFQPKERKY